MFYLDTSVLVAWFFNEPNSVRARAWLKDNQASQLAISDWVTTEFSSALSVKLRNRQIDVSQRLRVLAGLSTLSSTSFIICPVTRSEFTRAAFFADQHLSGLRAGDALHLAIASVNDATLVTLDRRLMEGGAQLGAAVVMV